MSESLLVMLLLYLGLCLRLAADMMMGDPDADH